MENCKKKKFAAQHVALPTQLLMHHQGGTGKKKSAARRPAQLEPARRASSTLDGLVCPGLLPLCFHYKPRSLAVLCQPEPLNEEMLERHSTRLALALQLERKAEDSYPSQLQASSCTEQDFYAALEKVAGCHEQEALPMVPTLEGVVLNCLENFRPVGMALSLLELASG